MALAVAVLGPLVRWLEKDLDRAPARPIICAALIGKPGVWAVGAAASAAARVLVVRGGQLAPPRLSKGVDNTGGLAREQRRNAKAGEARLVRVDRRRPERARLWLGEIVERALAANKHGAVGRKSRAIEGLDDSSR